MPTGREWQEAAQPGRLLASDADRERVVGLLKAAFVAGMLTKDELGERVGGALTARTYADLRIVTADIPARVAATEPRAKPARTRRRVGPRAKVGGVTVAAGVIMLASGALTGSGTGPAGNGFYLLSIVAFVVAFVTWLWTLSARPGDDSSGQRPPRPASGGHDGRARPAATAAERAAPADEARRDVTRATQVRPARGAAARTAFITQTA